MNTAQEAKMRFCTRDRLETLGKGKRSKKADLTLIYQWVKDGTISLSEYLYLVDVTYNIYQDKEVL